MLKNRHINKYISAIHLQTHYCDKINIQLHPWYYLYVFYLVIYIYYKSHKSITNYNNRAHLYNKLSIATIKTMTNSFTNKSIKSKRNIKIKDYSCKMREICGFYFMLFGTNAFSLVFQIYDSFLFVRPPLCFIYKLSLERGHRLIRE